jgi:hypothetical protein
MTNKYKIGQLWQYIPNDSNSNYVAIYRITALNPMKLKCIECSDPFGQDRFFTFDLSLYPTSYTMDTPRILEIKALEQTNKILDELLK